jgi:hypothetical protein
MVEKSLYAEAYLKKSGMIKTGWIECGCGGGLEEPRRPSREFECAVFGL